MPSEYYYRNRAALINAAKEIRAVCRDGMIHADAGEFMQGGTSPKGNNRIERGQYVPDDEHLEICLNCTKKICSGNCKLMAGRMKKKENV